MSAPKKILFADPDPDELRAVAPLLRERGYEVHAATDGSRALELAILRTPDLVVYDSHTPLLDPKTFLRILRSNPRTEGIPVLLAGRRSGSGGSAAAGWLEKPYQPEVLLARVDHLLRRADAARGAADVRHLEGDLAQMPLPDLLQILAMNRKAGRLRLDRKGERGEIAIFAGQPVAARLGAAQGEKAFYRLLARPGGQFSFQAAPGPDASPVPSPVPDAGRITRRLEELLLEGMRQADELSRIESVLPPLEAVLSLSSPGAPIPRGLQPVTEEVMRLLVVPRSFAELLDLATASDLEAARAAVALLDQGHAIAAEPTRPSDAHPFLQPELVHALRLRIARDGEPGGRPVGKVVVAGGSMATRQQAMSRFAALPGWEAVAGADDIAGLGTLGSLDLGAVRIDLVSLPGDRSQRPLWGPFASGAIGALVLLPIEGTEGLLLELTRVLRLPAAVAGLDGDTIPSFPGEPLAAVLHRRRDAVEALRALLEGASRRPGQ
jgi:DNA-binding response OmpR family regulator